MLIGLIWAALAPLMLVLAAFVLSKLLRRAGLRRAFPIAALLVVAPVATCWLIDRADFIAICEGEGLPVIYRRAAAEGILLDSGTANSFGMRYLHDEGFAWVEAPSIYQRGGWVRYQRAADGTIASRDIPAISARYEVRELFSQPNRHVGLAQTQVVDRSTGELLAKAGSAHFDGGRMKLVLGAWGSGSCPSAMSSPEAFNGYYHLAKRTLR